MSCTASGSEDAAAAMAESLGNVGGDKGAGNTTGKRVGANGGGVRGEMGSASGGVESCIGNSSDGGQNGDKGVAGKRDGAGMKG